MGLCLGGVRNMNTFEQQHFDFIYKQHLINLKLQGKRPATINAYARVIRCITDFFERSSDSLDYSGQPFPHTFKVEFSNSIGDRSPILV